MLKNCPRKTLLMSESFDFLFGDFRKKAVELLEGSIVHETKVPFSTEIMDGSYDFNGRIIKGLSAYFEEQQMVIKRVVVFNALITDLQRGPDSSMSSVQHLCVVKDAKGELNAVLFTGCRLGT